VRKSEKQSGDADDDAVVERERIDLVLVSVGLPQIERGKWSVRSSAMKVTTLPGSSVIR